MSRRWPGGSRALLVAVQGVRGVPCLRGRALASAGGKGKVGERGPSGCMRRNGVKFRAVQLCRGWRGWKGGEPPRRSSTGAQEPRCALTTQQLVTQGVHVFCNKRSPLGRSGSLGDIGYKGGWSGRWAAAPQTGSWAKGLQGFRGMKGSTHVEQRDMGRKGKPIRPGRRIQEDRGVPRCNAFSLGCLWQGCRAQACDRARPGAVVSLVP